jgi:hypothetical protein
MKCFSHIIFNKVLVFMTLNVIYINATFSSTQDGKLKTMATVHNILTVQDFLEILKIKEKT